MTQKTPNLTTQKTPNSTTQKTPNFTTQKTQNLTTQKTPNLTARKTPNLTTQKTPNLTTQKKAEYIIKRNTKRNVEYIVEWNTEQNAEYIVDQNAEQNAEYNVEENASTTYLAFSAAFCYTRCRAFLSTLCRHFDRRPVDVILGVLFGVLSHLIFGVLFNVLFDVLVGLLFCVLLDVKFRLVARHHVRCDTPRYVERFVWRCILRFVRHYGSFINSVTHHTGGEGVKKSKKGNVTGAGISKRALMLQTFGVLFSILLHAMSCILLHGIRRFVGR